jgi:hypothetical protein
MATTSDIRADRIRPLVDWVNQCFPGVNTRQVVPWAGLRPMMPNGKDNENGVRMAIEELNTQNIVIGGKKIRFEMVGGRRRGRSKAGHRSGTEAVRGQRFPASSAT